MANETGSSNVQIAIAVIGLIGSLGVAYITTGAAFKAQLAANHQEVAGLSDSVQKLQHATAKDLKEALGAVQSLQTALQVTTQNNGRLEAEVRAIEERLKTANVGAQDLSSRIEVLSRNRMLAAPPPQTTARPPH